MFTRTGALNLIITDEVVHQLGAILADGSTSFRATNAEAERVRTQTA